MKSAEEIIRAHAESGLKAREEFFRTSMNAIQESALQTAIRIGRGGKLLLCGNGGSAADAQHVAGEFVNKFMLDRPSLPAIALTTDTSVITAIGNDIDFEHIFSRQLEGLGNPGDTLLAISTSGNSPNILEVLKTARQKEIFTIGLTGETGGKMTLLCDLLLQAPSRNTPIIQEVHLAYEHIFCRLVDYYLFENVGLLKPYLT